MRLSRRHNSRLLAVALRLVVVVCLFLPEVTWSQCECGTTNSCSGCVDATQQEENSSKEKTPNSSPDKEPSKNHEPSAKAEKTNSGCCCCCSPAPDNSGGCCCTPNPTPEEKSPKTTENEETPDKPDRSSETPDETSSMSQVTASDCCSVSVNSTGASGCGSKCACTHVEVKVVSSPPVVLPAKVSSDHLTCIAIDLSTIVVDISGLFQSDFLTSFDSSPPPVRGARLLPVLCKWLK